MPNLERCGNAGDKTQRGASEMFLPNFSNPNNAMKELVGKQEKHFNYALTCYLIV
ncbi:unnamed protein product [Sphenostylis stenocarpa]|uniref:Uncharacterized protein n=1 Tax=Sphenostylis stenocarpa TaxID=92480 RepID=A0AA86S7T2_9FABA|nr:unnamed protein product [Sphenostylis stenocarpa]